MMRNILIPLVIISLVACNPGHPPGGDVAGADTLASKDMMFVYDDEYIQIETISRLNFEKHRPRDPKMDYDKTNLVAVQNDTLKFIIDGQAVLFTDTLVNTDDADIRINKHIADMLNFHVVKTEYYESVDWILIDKRNGKRHVLLSEPQLSPGGKYIVCYTGFGMWDAVYQLWEVSSSGLKKKFEIPTGEKEFSIEDVRWVSDEKQVVRISWKAEKDVYGMLTIR